MMKKMQFIKKHFLSFLGASILVSTPIILTSCSTTDSNLIDKTISKGDGNYFATRGSDNSQKNYDISYMAKEALKTDASAKTLSTYVINKLALDWIEKSSEEKGENELKRALKDQKKLIDDEYNSLVKTQKETHKANFPIKFQQDYLDLNGGTEESYKEKKLLDWAGTQLAERLFKRNYLAIERDGNIEYSFNNLEKQPLYDTGLLTEALENTGNSSSGKSKFVFSEKAIDIGNPYSDAEYAKFQQFIFDEWVKIEQPFVMNMSLWKYGAPTKGINTIYNSQATGITDSGTPSAGNYSFPYFTTVLEDSNTNGGTVAKFLNFLNDAKTKKNFISNDQNKAKLGLRDISTKTYSEDSSTLIFTKSSDIYSTLVIEFAAAGTYLFNQALHGDNGSTGTNTETSDSAVIKINQITGIDKSLNNISSSSGVGGLDVISSLFVEEKTQGASGANTGTNSSNPSKVLLSKDYVSKIINEKGPLSGLKSKDLYVIDAFKASDDFLKDFMFVRNEFGVHAIAIEGEKHIREADTATNALKRSGNIVLYHAFNGAGKTGEDGALQINIKEELSTFYKNNIAYLISKYIQNNSEQKLFNTNSLDQNLKTLFDKLSVYLFELSRVEKPKEYNDKMHQQKQNYSNNYGVNAIKNGLAAGWIYKKENNKYDVSQTVKSFKVDPFAANGSFKAYLDTINSYVDNLNLSQLKSGFSGFKYSQYIYSNDFMINQVLYTFGSDSTAISDSLKIDILSDYLKDDFDLSTLKFKSTANFAIPGSSAYSNDQMLKALNNAMAAVQYSSTFDSLTSKWSQYDNTSGKADTTNAFNVDKLNEYKTNLYKRTLVTNSSASLSTNVSILTVAATAKYMMEESGKEFMHYLSDQVQYGKDSYILWTGNVDTNLTETTKVPKDVKSLLDASKITQNINNSYESAYFGLENKTNAGGGSSGSSGAGQQQDNGVTTNNTSSLFSTDSKYYSVVNNMIGFNGLVNNESAIDSKVIKNTIFFENKNVSYTKGVLYSYGSKDELWKYIDGLNHVYEIQSLAEDLKKKVPNISDDQISTAGLTLEDAKNKLKVLLGINNGTKQQNPIVTNDMFKIEKADAEIGGTPSTSGGGGGAQHKVGANTTTSKSLLVETDIENISVGAFAIPLNTSNIETLEKLNTHLNTYKDSSSSTTGFSEAIYALLIGAASISEYQDKALNQILQNRKLDVYDVRLNTQLGPKWAKNWKN